MINTKRILRGLLLLIWLAIPFFLLLTPLEKVSSAGDLCMSKILFDRTCPGCGLTRATFSMAQLNFSAAWQFNKLSVITTPILIMVWFHVLGRIIRRPMFSWMRGFY